MKKSFYIVLLSVFLILSCNEKSNNTNNEVVLAKVGDAVITVDEFRKNYELGFGNLKKGNNPKKTYLDYMINEKILALEGYDLGYDKFENVQKSLKTLEKELLIETLLQTEVKDKINVSDEEIRDAINKSKVSFKFRYWVEPNFNRALKVAEAMKVKGYADVVDEILMENPEYIIDPKLLETDYLDYMQVSPDVLAAIQDLPYGEISDPVEMRDHYYIFQVVDIRRGAVTENEYMTKASSFEQIVFYRKFEQALVEYGTRLLDPKNIKTKRNAFDMLAEALQEWKTINPNERTIFSEDIQKTKNNRPALNKLHGNLDMPFFEYNEGEVSIEEFLKSFKAKKFLKDFEGKTDFIGFLHSEIQSTIRDYFLLKEAEKKDLRTNPKLQNELSLWRDKLVYGETRNNLVKNVTVNENEVEDYFEHHQDKYKSTKNITPKLSSVYKQVKRDAFQNQIHSKINEEIETLKKKYGVQINETVLDTIKVVEFQKSKWATMQVFKSGSNRPALPVVDPNWSLNKQ